MKKNDVTVQDNQANAEPATSAPAELEPRPQSCPMKFRVASAIGLNVRSGPGFKYPILKQLACGNVVEVEDAMVEEMNVGLWAPVKGGWVAAEFLELIDEEA